MEFLLAIFVFVPIAALAIFIMVLVINLIFMHHDQNIHLWPAVTSCRLCEKRIWVWQPHEYREYKLKTDNPDNIAIWCGMSGIVHKNCHGTPEVLISIHRGD
ncbi:MAG: hypothetical protein COU29_01215 [Candidatus Magasanikbacteria bacterium CG10_big_fil_rev_8_21_14_0_10_36_32]|uniref:Uncharacterized protein n=1 Tax=Candidatus Magasanikbacteria bacterium CG10_big_fil_rev_8_21_14_0_10_36_32 TaxID=1974646 RepID=A0A2M6W6H1_9BACT|nr:MAG: hypothetical protein COU29_01215 [Candidatus Magasanikbacteria bacterium CG10_big_fil_rev_8_21_14_0_10_36_32]